MTLPVAVSEPSSTPSPAPPPMAPWNEVVPPVPELTVRLRAGAAASSEMVLPNVIAAPAGVGPPVVATVTSPQMTTGIENVMADPEVMTSSQTRAVPLPRNTTASVRPKGPSIEMPPVLPSRPKKTVLKPSAKSASSAAVISSSLLSSAESVAAPRRVSVTVSPAARLSASLSGWRQRSKPGPVGVTAPVKSISSPVSTRLPPTDTVPRKMRPAPASVSSGSVAVISMPGPVVRLLPTVSEAGAIEALMITPLLALRRRSVLLTRLRPKPVGIVSVPSRLVTVYRKSVPTFGKTVKRATKNWESRGNCPAPPASPSAPATMEASWVRVSEPAFPDTGLIENCGLLVVTSKVEAKPPPVPSPATSVMECPEKKPEPRTRFPEPSVPEAATTEPPSVLMSPSCETSPVKVSVAAAFVVVTSPSAEPLKSWPVAVNPSRARTA